MADLTMTPVATQIQPVRPMTLGEMLNLASGVQQYRQAQQMNPLLLQAQQQTVEQAAQVNPLLLQQQQIATRVAGATEQPRIAQQAAQTGLAQTQEQQARFALSGDKRNAALNIAGAYAVDPRIVNPKTPDEPINALTEAFTALKARGLTDAEALTHVAPFVTMAQAQPGQLSTMLQAAVRQGVGTAGQLPLQTPQLTTQFGGQPAAVAPGALGTTQVQPVQMPGAPAPMAAPPAGVPSAAAPTGMVLPYPIRQAGVPFAMAPSEQADTEAGIKYRSGLVAVQPTLVTSRRNIEEVLKKAGELTDTNVFQSGFAGDLERKIRSFIGDPRYKELSKDLANIQISMLQASGGSMQTDAGKQLMAVANGDETYPPQVLIAIARRTAADITKMDLEAQAAQKFAQRFGDNNLKAFQQAWTANADSRIFEAMNIMRDVTDPKARKEQIDKLFGSDPKRRQEYFDRYQRLQRLVQTGSVQ
jgi:hypothetical protein